MASGYGSGAFGSGRATVQHARAHMRGPSITQLGASATPRPTYYLQRAGTFTRLGPAGTPQRRYLAFPDKPGVTEGRPGTASITVTAYAVTVDTGPFGLIQPYFEFEALEVL